MHPTPSRSLYVDQSTGWKPRKNGLTAIFAGFGKRAGWWPSLDIHLTFKSSVDSPAHGGSTCSRWFDLPIIGWDEAGVWIAKKLVKNVIFSPDFSVQRPRWPCSAHFRREIVWRYKLYVGSLVKIISRQLDSLSKFARYGPSKSLTYHLEMKN